jgi:hypothetical protein
MCRTQLLSIVGHWSKFKESAYFSLLTLILRMQDSRIPEEVIYEFLDLE